MEITCKNCGVKDFDFEDYCKSCDRDNKIDELEKENEQLK